MTSAGRRKSKGQPWLSRGLRSNLASTKSAKHRWWAPRKLSSPPWSPQSDHQSHGPSSYDVLSTNSDLSLISKAFGSGGRSCPPFVPMSVYYRLMTLSAWGGFGGRNFTADLLTLSLAKSYDDTSLGGGPLLPQQGLGGFAHLSRPGASEGKACRPPTSSLRGWNKCYWERS